MRRAQETAISFILSLSLSHLTTILSPHVPSTLRFFGFHKFHVVGSGPPFETNRRGPFCNTSLFCSVPTPPSPQVLALICSLSLSSLVINFFASFGRGVQTKENPLAPAYHFFRNPTTRSLFLPAHLSITTAPTHTTHITHTITPKQTRAE